jgi:hypothetical protein
MINKDMMVLQTYIDLGNAVPGPCAETCTTSHDATQAMNIKSEEVSDADEEEDPLQITLPEMKAEPEVSCMSVCPLLGRYQKYAGVPIVFLSPSLCLCT